MPDHWTDQAPEPVFTTVIRARGEAENIFAIVGTACRLLRQLDIPADRIDALRKNAASAGSYDQAVALVERWFPVNR